MNEFQGYVSQLMDGNYLPSHYCIMGIDCNYKFLLKFLNKDSRILEIGPGNGSFIDYLIMNDFTCITCVDLDEENANNLRKKYKKIKNINVFYGDGIEFLNSNESKFDLIISRQVLEHLNSSDVLKYFKSCHSSLNQGGLLITETINAQNIYYNCFHRFDDSTHKNSFTEKSIIQYSGKLFQHKFLEYKNMSLINLLTSPFRQEKYNKLLGLISVENQFNNKESQSKLSLIKKGFSFVRHKYYHWRSKKISKKYLKNENNNIFTYYLIVVSRKTNN